MNKIENFETVDILRELHFSKIRKEKAITLIALVITIVILLILAGIAISQLTQTGLFSRINQAKSEWTNAQNMEETTLGEYENEITGYLSENESSSESEDITEPSASISLSATAIYTTGQ